MITEWHHAPVHRFESAGSYIITAGTYGKEHHFRSRRRLDFLANELLTRAERIDATLHARAVFSNHYHAFLDVTDPGALKQMLSRLHSETSLTLNQEDHAVGRTVWYEFWDTKITNSRSFFCRVRYVHENPVRHGLVREAIHYPWCSAGWFQRRASVSLQKKLETFKIDEVRVLDTFNPVIPD